MWSLLRSATAGRTDRKSLFVHLRLYLLPSLFIVASVLLVPGAAGAENSSACQILGTEADDVLMGTAGDDVICGLGGDDVIIGGLGDDRLIGGPGDDRLIGGPGDDVLRGGNGSDDLAGGDGADTLWGGNNNDLLRGSNGSDVLYGGVGGDVLRGGSGSDRLRGGPDDDVCVDSWAKTNGIGCEYGIGGDKHPVAVNEAIWRLRGNDEFVYSVSVHDLCSPDAVCPDESFIDIVHVRGGDASSAFGSTALSSTQLFGRANEAIAAGRSVTFDRGAGLPRQIEGPDGSRVVIHEISLRDTLREAVDDAESRWIERAVTAYSYTATSTCLCPDSGPVQVKVVGGQATAAPLDGSDVEWPRVAKTIDDHLTDLIEVLDGHAIDVTATFESSSAMLRSYVVDRDRQLSGDEFGITISEFAIGTLVAIGEHPADDIPPTLTIVDVGGIEVSSVISGDLQELIERSTQAGFMLSGGGFRDPQRQIDLRRVNCGTTDFAIFEMPADQCSPPTARPGQSQHELGLAIDFTSGGRLITSTADPAFLWLVDNASSVGLFNLPGEPWHWSTTGN